MKTKHLKNGLGLVAAGLTSVLCVSIDLSSSQPPLPALETVHEASRVAHAKELLGSLYDRSQAFQVSGVSSLNEELQAKVKRALAPQWKSQARQITRTIINESAKYKLDPVFVMALIKTESSFNPLAVGSSGEIGLMQVRPETAKWIARKFNIAWEGAKTLENPSTNIRIGLAYMNYLRTQFRGEAQGYVSAYNMGPRNVRRLLAQNVKPAVYNGRVMKHYHDLYTNLGQSKIRLLAIN